ncbi:SPOSA6832_01334, partial [Sporobolomyces salmonicolor]
MSHDGSSLGTLSLEDHPGSLPLDLIERWENDLDKDPSWAFRLFAMCNVVRIFTSLKYNLGEFQLSQSYLFFYDHLSKANWFLEQMIDLVDEPIDALLPELTQIVVQASGISPLPSSRPSASFRRPVHPPFLLSSICSNPPFPTGLSVIFFDDDCVLTSTWTTQLKVVYRILTICCGAPPKPDENVREIRSSLSHPPINHSSCREFVWEFADKDKKYHRVLTTPLDFARKHAGYNPSDTISIVNDPRHPWKVPMTVERLGNVVGGRPLRYLNMPSDTLKNIAISLIKSNIPVWFGCDVDKSSNTDVGIMDLRLFDYQDAFGTVLGMNKEERLRLGDSSMTHAMMFTAVHIDAVTGKPVRWRVENSWGPDICNKGFLVMTGAWFDEYVFQIAAPRAYVPRQLLDIYDRADKDSIIKLPAYDPLGLAA